MLRHLSRRSRWRCDKNHVGYVGPTSKFRSVKTVGEKELHIPVTLVKDSLILGSFQDSIISVAELLVELSADSEKKKYL